MLDGPSLYLAPSDTGDHFIDIIIQGHRITVHKRALAEAIKGVIELTSSDGIIIAGEGI